MCMFQASDCGSLKWSFNNDTHLPGSDVETDDELIIFDQIGRLFSYLLGAESKP